MLEWIINEISSLPSISAEEIIDSVEDTVHVNWMLYVFSWELLQKFNSSLPSDTQWIDVKEDPGQAWEYLIFDPEDSRCTDYFIRWKWEYTNPTHWMPLPTPPNN